MRTLFFYSRGQFFNFKASQEAFGFKVTNISKFLLPDQREELDEYQKVFVDVSSLVSLIKSNDSQTMNFEQLIDCFGENVEFICDKVHERDIKYLFRYSFDGFSDVEAEYDKRVDEQDTDTHLNFKEVKKITDLNNTELESFFEAFNSKLYGHERFKKEFKSLVTSFRVFNKLGEHKILSLFLMGDSGVGKTEVARTIHKALGSHAKLAKINFGNYSSHDALNSLIGSPLGYIGSDGGELLKRIQESDVGLILIDEFEKADNAVFNYFLDVLENGKIVNSQADEYDINGYIIVFTSNISKENFKEKISPELRSRFDYKGMFNLLTNEDKKKFVHFRVNQIMSKYREFVSPDIPEKLHGDVVSIIDVSRYRNMRDLNKKIKDTFVELIDT
ncbi:MAG: AAA family ATPase [Prevotellaceae bacterium]|nr:AAA family ATPase [Prevotellaceae bacterium]